MSIPSPAKEERNRTGVRHPELWALLVIVILTLAGANLSNGAGAFLSHAGGPDLLLPHAVALDGELFRPVSPAAGLMAMQDRMAARQCELARRMVERQTRLADHVGPRMEQRIRAAETRTAMRLKERTRRVGERLRLVADRISCIGY